MLFDKWKDANIPRLKSVKAGDRPKALIEMLSENLLEAFRAARLLDAYDVYQHLMDYWAATMQDDVYMLVQEGWKAVLEGKPNIDLIPAPLIITRYFSHEQTAVEEIEANRDAISRQMEELDEEHAGEDGLLANGRTDKGKLTKASVKARLAEITADSDAGDERKVLQGYLDLIEEEAAASRQLRDAQKAVEAQVAAKYVKLNADEIKILVVDDKWVSQLAADVQGELDRVSRELTGRVRQLADRYIVPLPRLVGDVNALAARVNEHLRKMGAACN
jgi:type I restriction enzyme M protein